MFVTHYSQFDAHISIWYIQYFRNIKWPFSMFILYCDINTRMLVVLLDLQILPSDWLGTHLTMH